MSILTTRTIRSVRALCGTITVSFVLLLTFSSAAVAQATRDEPLPTIIHQKGVEDPDKKPTTIEDEMAAKRAIKAADKEYQDNLERARDLSVLSGAIVTSFKEKKLLDREDIKKLEKVEKLAKGIRNAAGGSEDEAEMEEPPKDLRAAVTMLGDLSKSLKEKVEKTPKHVISAVVIDEANVLLQVVRFVRMLPAQD